MLFIDNPVGTPYSYTDNLANAPSTAIASAQDLVTGINIWFSNGFFSEYKSNDLYFFGESYGGKYVVALATQVMNNPLAQNWNLKGIGMGNAWVAPDIQESIYGNMGYTIGILGYSNVLSINKYGCN